MATILVIDDDPTTLGLLRGRLQKAGYAVVEAKDGQEGLDMAEKGRPDLIFLDVRMPKVELMTAQLLRLATSLMASYQSALSGTQADFRLKIGLVDQQAGELTYWLGLLQDSRASDDLDIPLLLAESKVLHEAFTGSL